MKWIKLFEVASQFKKKRSWNVEELAEYSRDPRALDELAVHSSGVVRRLVAGNSSTSEEALMWLIQDPTESVKEAAVQNPNLSSEGMLLASRDPNAYLRMAIAHRKDVPIRILLGMRGDQHARFPYAEIASRVEASIGRYLETCSPEERESLEGLLNMHDLGIRTSEDPVDLEGLDLDLDLGESRRSVERFQLWESRSAEGFKARAERARLSQDPAELDRFSRDKSYQVLIEVAQNPWTPPEALLRIISTTWGFAADLAIKNPNCPEEALWYAADSNSYSMRLELVQLRTAPIEILIYMLKKGDVPGVMKELKNSIHRHLDELDPGERARVESLLTMHDLGITISEDPVDLDDLDLDDLEDDEYLGESRREVERFQLWESRGRSRYK